MPDDNTSTANDPGNDPGAASNDAVPTTDDVALNSDIFADGDSRVPGELVVVLTPEANQTVVASIANAGSAGEPAATALGIASVDQLLATLQPMAIDKLHDEVPSNTAIASDGGSTDPLAEIAAWLDSTYLIKFNPELDPDSVISQLSALPEVVSVEPNYFMSSMLVPNDSDWPQQWGPATIHCPQAWDVTTGAASIIVAIVDSGVDVNHPDLVPQLIKGRNFVDIHGSAPAGWHYVGHLTGPDDVVQDEVGHGTHVAGIVGALGNNSSGVAGVVWKCKLLPVRVMARTVNDSDPNNVTGMGTNANIASGIIWAVGQGAKVINLSVGGPSTNISLSHAIAFAVGAGVLVVAAMGNGPTSHPRYPAALPGVFAVGSIGRSDQPSWFSNSGSHMAICAPGEQIHSTYFDLGGAGSTYANLSGTSMATPHVAGVAALAWSAAPTKTAADIAAALKGSARTLPITDPTKVGAGCVDCLGTLRAIAPATAGTTSTDPSGTTTDPSGTTTDPSGSTTDPSGRTTNPSGSTTDPSGTTTDPSGTTTDPSGTTTDPSGTTTDPSNATDPSNSTDPSNVPVN